MDANIPVPRLDLARVLSTRDDLYTRLWKPFHDGDRPSGDQFNWMVDEALLILQSRGVGRRALVDSLAHLIDRPLDKALLWDAAWRLAGNVPALKAGRAAPPWTHQAAPEWVPACVTAAIEAANRRGRHGCEFRFAALAGSYCPWSFSKWWSRPQCGFIAREVGFSTVPSGKMRFRHPYQLVGLRLVVLFEPDRGRDGKPGFHRVACPPALAAFNRTILRRRFRLTPCPFLYRHDCHRCAVGYAGKAGCYGATHAAAYAPGACPACGHADAPFDPELTGGLCVTCTTKTKLFPADR